VEKGRKRFSGGCWRKEYEAPWRLKVRMSSTEAVGERKRRLHRD
jgi:hypothetical protein